MARRYLGIAMARPILIPTLTILVSANLVVTGFLLTNRTAEFSAERNTPQASKAPPSEVAQLAHRLNTIQSQFAQSLNEIAANAGTTAEGYAEQDGFASLANRLNDMEQSIERLQDSMSGIDMQKSSEDRAKLFATENGHLRADEYFEAGKFAIAGEGYLKFLEAHPDHADHKNILQRAQRSFSRAGYHEKAIWAQEELIRIYPQNKGEALMDLAKLEMSAGRYSDAIGHAEESAANDSTTQRYWSLLYAAYYTELEHGAQAGLDYYRKVSDQIDSAGLGEERLGERAQERIDALARQVANQRD